MKHRPGRFSLALSCIPILKLIPIPPPAPVRSFTFTLSYWCAIIRRASVKIPQRSHMRCAASLLGAGRTSTGITPPLAPTFHPYLPQLNSPSREFTLSGASGMTNVSVPFYVVSALSSLQPSVTTAKITFGLNSNRHLVRLESHVSFRKQTTEVRSNRH